MNKLWIKYLKTRKKWLKNLDLPNEGQIRKLEKVNLSLYRAGAFGRLPWGQDLTDEPFSKQEYFKTLAEQRDQLWEAFVQDNPTKAIEMYRAAHLEQDRDNHIYVEFEDTPIKSEDNAQRGFVIGFIAGKALKPLKFFKYVGQEKDSLQSRHEEVNGIRKLYYSSTHTD